MAAMKLTPEQQKLIKSFNEKDKKVFDALQTDEEKTRYLNDLLEIDQLATESLKSGDAFVDSATLEEQDDTLILRPGGIGLREGTVIVAEFLGTMPMWSTTPQKNWKSDTVTTESGLSKQVWFNLNYRFRGQNGKEFGIYQTPGLTILKKVPTLATKINTPEKNPVVRIDYKGLIEGAERLKNEYGMEITDGDKAHVFGIGFEKGFKFNKYVRGIVNLLKTPKPNFGTAETDRKTLSEELFSSFEKYSTENDLMIDNNSTAQVERPAIQ